MTAPLFRESQRPICPKTKKRVMLHGNANKLPHHFMGMVGIRAIGSLGSARLLVKVLKACGLHHKNRGSISAEGQQRLMVVLVEAGRIGCLNQLGIEQHRLLTVPGAVAVMPATFKSLQITQMETSRSALRLGILHSLVH